MRSLTNRTLSLRASVGLVEKLRRIKDAGEIALIRKVCEIANRAFDLTIRDNTGHEAKKEVAC